MAFYYPLTSCVLIKTLYLHYSGSYVNAKCDKSTIKLPFVFVKCDKSHEKDDISKLRNDKCLYTVLKNNYTFIFCCCKNYKYGKSIYHNFPKPKTYKQNRLKLSSHFAVTLISF